MKHSHSVTNKMWHFSIYLFLWDAVHVSDGFSIHHQELKSAHKASGICQANTWCCTCMCSFEPLMMNGKTIWNL